MKKLIFLALILSFLPQVSFGQNIQNCLDLSANLKQGQRDSVGKTDVSSLQNFLKNAGYLNANATGFFGAQTLKAVKAFQKAKNINPTGLVGPLTRASIKNFSCGAISEPVPTPTPVEPAPPITETPTPPVVNDEVISSGNSSSLRAKTDGVIVVGSTSSTLRGQVTAGARSGTVGFFEVTTNPSVYKVSETIISTKVSQRSNDKFEISLLGLKSETNYYFRACAENASLGQKSCGGTSTFTTTK